MNPTRRSLIFGALGAPLAGLAPLAVAMPAPTSTFKPRYSIHGCVTGRFSSTIPNLTEVQKSQPYLGWQTHHHQQLIVDKLLELRKVSNEFWDVSWTPRSYEQFEGRRNRD